MSTRAFTTVAIAALALSACASIDSSPGGKRLASLHLFDAQSHPNFIVYVACSGEMKYETIQCATVSHAFHTWSHARNIHLDEIGPDDPLFSTGRPLGGASPAPSGEPYCVAIRFEPVIVPSMDTWSGTMGTMTSGTVPGRAGYLATLYVFSRASGALLRKLPLHAQVEMPEHADVTPTIKADAYAVIHRIDPAYPIP